MQIDEYIESMEFLKPDTGETIKEQFVILKESTPWSDDCIIGMLDNVIHAIKAEYGE